MGKTVLVTGGSSGVGESLVSHLSKEFEVVTCARRIEKLEEKFKNKNNVHPIYIDLEENNRIFEKIQSINEEYGPILHAVNNAAIYLNGSIKSLDVESITRSIDINTTAPLIILQALVPTMKQHDFGRIVNVTSGASINCPTGAIPYSASKAALNTATVTAAKELSEYNVKINLMSPGPTKSEMAPDAPLNPTACHPTVDYLLSLDEDGPSGKFFWLGNRVPLFPELGDVDWESGQPSEEMERVID